MTRPTRRPSEYALTIGAAIGVICIVWTIVAVAMGMRPLIFSSGSMAPAIPTGSMAVARTTPATDLHRGDIVSVRREDGSRVTHRVDRVVSSAGNSVVLQLKGDANNTVDPQTYVVTTADRVLFSVPGLGYVASGLMNRYALALEVLAALALLWMAFGPSKRPNVPPAFGSWWSSGEHSGSEPPTNRLGAIATSSIAVVAVIATLVAAMTSSGQARAVTPLTATATAKGTVTAGTVPNPTSLTCTNTTTSILLVPFSTVQLSWPNPASNAAFTYELSFPGQSTAPITIAASGQPNPITYTFTSGILQSILSWLIGAGSQYPVVLTITRGTFRSSAPLTQLLRATTFLETPAGIKCVTAGTVQGLASQQARLAAPVSSGETTTTSTSPSTSSSSSAPTSTSTTTTTAPTTGTTTTTTTSAPAATTTTSAAPALPAGGDTSPTNGFAAYTTGGNLTIRDTATAAVVYTAPLDGDTATWQPNTDVLVVTAPDGSVSNVKSVNGKWVSSPVSGPTTTAAAAPATTTAADQQTTGATSTTAAGTTTATTTTDATTQSHTTTAAETTASK